MRSFEHAHTLPSVPQDSHYGAEGAAEENYFLNRRSNASRASLALRGGGVFMPGIGPREAPFWFCVEVDSRATVTRDENSVHSLA